MAKRPRLSAAAAEAAIILIVLGLMTAAGFVGWVIGNYAGNGSTTTVTVGASTSQSTSSSTSTSASTETATTQTATTAVGGDVGNPTAGKSIFTSAGCASCHTLKAAGSNGTIGPNLDERKPSIDKVVERVTEGKPPMPSFRDSLTSFQIQSVAAFVYASTH